jgi:hypothetical protein
MLLGTVAVFLAVVTLSLRADETRSAEIQHHGLRLQGTVRSVHANTSTSESQRYGSVTRVTSFLYSVEFEEPFRGVDRTNLHAPASVVLKDGASVAVLVDPRDPTYAEFPGTAAFTKGGWIYVLAGSLVAWLAIIVAVFKGTAPGKRTIGG